MTPIYGPSCPSQGNQFEKTNPAGTLWTLGPPWSGPGDANSAEALTEILLVQLIFTLLALPNSNRHWLQGMLPTRGPRLLAKGRPAPCACRSQAHTGLVGFCSRPCSVAKLPPPLSCPTQGQSRPDNGTVPMRRWQARPKPKDHARPRVVLFSCRCPCALTSGPPPSGPWRPTGPASH